MWQLGHAIAQLRLIFRIIPPLGHPDFVPSNQFLIYAQRYDTIPQINIDVSGSSTTRGPYPDPTTGLHILKRAKRSNQTVLGDVVPLSQVQSLLELTPRFGEKADRRLTKENSMMYASEFWLNKYFTKELFYALHK